MHAVHGLRAPLEPLRVKEFARHLVVDRAPPPFLQERRFMHPLRVVAQ